eukprot:972342_1
MLSIIHYLTLFYAVSIVSLIELISSSNLDVQLGCGGRPLSESQLSDLATGKGYAYRGCTSKTISGKTCQRWTSQHPHRHTRTASNYPHKGIGNHNYCRNPDGEPTIWCYTTDPHYRWDYCVCPGTEASRGWRNNEYRGCQTRTRSGRTCQKWTSQSPHRHSRTESRYPDKGIGNHHFCRNPDGEHGIWCYTQDRHRRWEYCSPLPSSSHHPIPNKETITKEIQRKQRERREREKRERGEREKRERERRFRRARQRETEIGDRAKRTQDRERRRKERERRARERAEIEESVRLMKDQLAHERRIPDEYRYAAQWRLVVALQDIKQGTFKPAVKVEGREHQYNAFANTYCVLGIINPELFKDPGDNDLYTFKLYFEYADGRTDTLLWKQSSWPTESGTIEGYDPIAIPKEKPGATAFKGLALSSRAETYLDGNGDEQYWWNSVATIQKFQGGIPAFDGKIATSERLYVRLVGVANVNVM